jgi:hypothetical protein
VLTSAAVDAASCFVHHSEPFNEKELTRLALHPLEREAALFALADIWCLTEARGYNSLPLVLPGPEDLPIGGWSREAAAPYARRFASSLNQMRDMPLSVGIGWANLYVINHFHPS